MVEAAAKKTAANGDASIPAAKAGRRSRAPRATLPSRDVEPFFATLAAGRPDPKTELVFRNPFTLLIAVLLSAQATDAGVNKATANLFDEADNPADMLALGEGHVRDRIKTIGLFRNKAKNVIALSEILLAEYSGEVPADRASLEALPGVGRKTANVVLNEAFGVPTIAVDTHVFRVANRTGLAPGRTPDEVEARLMRRVPKSYLKGAHHWLILHGRYVCTARKPDCSACVVSAFCRYKEKSTDPGR